MAARRLATLSPRRPQTRRWLLAVLAAALLPCLAPSAAAHAQSGAPAAPAEPAVEPKTDLADIEDEVMCPICGVPLEMAIDAPQAIQERRVIRELIAQGLTKEEIKDRLVEEYGPEVLALPSTEGFDLAAWLVPGVAIVIAAGAIFVGLRRWRRAGRGDGGPDSAEPDGDGLGAEDSRRLEADLARYEL